MKRKALSLTIITAMIILSATTKLDVQAKDIEEKSNKVTISFIGDCTLGGYRGQPLGRTYNEYYDANGGDYFLSNVKSIIDKDDITFINLEGAFSSKEATADKKYPIRCPMEHIDIISNASVEVVNLSNNHIYDCGKSGFNETIQLLKDNNIGYCGEGNTYTTKVNGIQVSFLGYNGWNDSKDLKHKIAQDIEAAKTSGSSIVCVEFHWGIERDNYSNSTQESLAHHAIDSGASIVVGSHPHVIQGIEKYKGKTIVYSMGNFSFGANKNPDDKDTFIYQETLSVSQNNNGYTIDSNIIPCSISSQTSTNDYKPTPLTLENKERVIERLSKYSSKYDDTLEILKK